MKIFFIPINSPLKRIKSINCTKCNLYIFYFRYILQLLPSAEVKIQNTKKKKKRITQTLLTITHQHLLTIILKHTSKCLFLFAFLKQVHIHFIKKYIKIRNQDIVFGSICQTLFTECSTKFCNC